MWDLIVSVPDHCLSFYFKKLLSVKQCTLNEFVYGELGRCSFQNKRFYAIIKYWLKIIHCQNTKYVKIVYDMLVNDFNVNPNKVNWVKLLHNLLGELGLMESKKIAMIRN